MLSLDEIIKKANRQVWVSMGIATVALTISTAALFNAGDYFCIARLAEDVDHRFPKESEEES